MCGREEHSIEVRYTEGEARQSISRLSLMSKMRIITPYKAMVKIKQDHASKLLISEPGRQKTILAIIFTVTSSHL